MPNSKELFSYYHSSPEFKTIGDLVEDRNSVIFGFHDDPEGFLSVIGEDGLTNRQRLENTYRWNEQKRFIGAKAAIMPIPVGILFYIPFDKVQELSLVTDGIEVVSTDEPAFKAKALADLEADKGYTQVIRPIKGQFTKGSIKQSFPECSVWIWCRALSPKGDEDKDLTGQIFDITPFIMNCSTNMSKNGGNFQLTLPALTCELDEDRRWVLKKANINGYQDLNGTSLQGMGYVSQSSILTPNSDDELERTPFLFHNMISSNDLVFIIFETLDMERAQRFSDLKEFFIDKQSLPNRIYDMIGLVDANTQSVNPENNQVTTTINGRDLSKLLIEDGTYFYALENSQGQLKFAGQSESKHQLIDRIYGDGALQFLALYFHSSIEVVMKFIMQQLANIEVVPTDLFSQYGDRVNKRFKVYEPQSKSNSDFKKIQRQENAAGIWQIIKLVIDESVSTRRIQDNSFSQANGSLLNFIRTLCQEPLVEFFMDTYGDQYHFIIRKPPTDQRSLISLIEGTVNTETGKPETPPAIVDVEQEDVIQESLSFDDSQVYSWYHFYPKAAFFGGNDFSLSYIGALHFEEYAKIYGSKPFHTCHPYLPYVPQNETKQSIDLYERQTIEDLRFVIESSQYLPFTRKGKLVLNRDRRIKVGNVIRYKSTGEIFFVDAVKQSYQISDNGIEAITVVNVSRGMVEQLIYGTFFTTETGEKRHVSYFNLINTDLEFHQKDVIKKVIKRRAKKTANKAAIVQGGTNINQQKTTALVPFLSDSFGNIPALANNEVIEKGGNKGIGFLDKYGGHTENKNLFVRFINEINSLGYWLEIGSLSTQRTYAEQKQLKHQNKLNASPGHSKHEHYSAIDIVAINKTTGQRHGKTSDKVAWVATGIPTLAKSLGLQWAGGEGSFGDYVDRVHFQIIDSSVLNKSEEDFAKEEVFEEYTETVKTKVLDNDKVFGNFKVNKFSFNFFQKNLQFDPTYRKVLNRDWEFAKDGNGTPLDVVVRATRKNS